MVTQDQLKNLSERVSKLKIYLDIDKKLIEISNEEEKTADPSFWNNPKEAEILMKSNSLHDQRIRSREFPDAAPSNLASKVAEDSK